MQELMHRLIPVLETLTSEYEIILVDDCSRDQSWRVIEELARNNSQIRSLQLRKNQGQASATRYGLLFASYEIVVTMDDDLQHQPDQLVTLIDSFVDNPDIDCVFGIFEQKHHAKYRNVASRLMQHINVKAFQLPADVRTSGFRVMSRELAQCIAAQETANPAIAVLLFRCTNRVMSVPVAHSTRFVGSSTYSFSKQIRLALDNICNVTLFPLRMVSLLGFGGCVISFGLLVFYLIWYLLGNITVPGWTTVVLLLVFFCGILLVSIGLLGEYMIRILREVTPRPGSMIRQSIGFDKDVKE
jgi:dolichol-phosphate mannosyltransferase/undecaprenyl-phosphate 4-deoxy-4-formamido-L-arabinose transferase